MIIFLVFFSLCSLSQEPGRGIAGRPGLHPWHPGPRLTWEGRGLEPWGLGGHGSSRTVRWGFLTAWGGASFLGGQHVSPEGGGSCQEVPEPHSAAFAIL